MTKVPHRGRLAPLSSSAWKERTGQAVSARKPLDILATIARHPTLLEPFLGWSATLALEGKLSRRDSELLALRTAWNCRSPFEWGQHVLYARAAGLGGDDIDRVPRGPSARGWSAQDADLLRAADELHSAQDLCGETWDRLRARFSDAQLVEIPFVVGQYTMLSMVANATGVPVAEDLPSFPVLD